MNENPFLSMEVTFNQYYNDSGKRIVATGHNKGVFFGFTTHYTEDGLQTVGVVRTGKKEICYVPTNDLSLSSKRRVVH